MTPKVRIVSNGEDTLYFVGRREVEKPVLLDCPKGNVVAVSLNALGGKKHCFTQEDVADIPDMRTIKTPDWLLLSAVIE